mgnify:CR=1 FL=1
MFYEKSLNLKKISYKKYNYSNFSNGMNSEIDETLLPLRFAKNTYNFDFNNGALKTGLGISEAYLLYDAKNPTAKKLLNYPEGLDILGAWVFKQFNHYSKEYNNMFIVYCSDKYLYVNYLYATTPALVKISSLTFSSCPTILNYKVNGEDTILICTPEDGLFFWNNVQPSEKIESAPMITSMCMHYERLFATGSLDKRSLWFSDDMNPTNWNLSLTEGGFIQMIDEKGTLNKVVSFDDYLYVFREYGIARVVAYANQSEFSVTQLYTSNNRIYEKTIAVCGDRVMFLASDGVYSFNGITTTKLTLGIENLLNVNINSQAIGAYFDGYYYIACKMSFPDFEEVECEAGDYKNNVLLEINLKSWTINILRGVDIYNMQAITDEVENALFVCVKHEGKVRLGKVDKSGQVYSKATKKVWCAPRVDFNLPIRKKLIKEMSIITKTDITIEFDTDGKKKSMIVFGKQNAQKIFPNVTGYFVGINFISAQAEVEISNPQIIVGVL